MSIIASRIDTLTGFYSTPGNVLQKSIKYMYWFKSINVFWDQVKKIMYTIDYKNLHLVLK